MKRRELIAEARGTLLIASILGWAGGLVLLVWAVYGLAIQRFGSTAQTTMVNGLYPNSVAVIENGLLAIAAFALGIGGTLFLMFTKEPLPDPQAERKLTEAAGLIQQSKYAEARTVLESIPNDHIAHEWLQQLDVLQKAAPVEQKAAGSS